jgi:hypothetical protein
VNGLKKAKTQKLGSYFPLFFLHTVLMVLSFFNYFGEIFVVLKVCVIFESRRRKQRQEERESKENNNKTRKHTKKRNRQTNKGTPKKKKKKKKKQKKKNQRERTRQAGILPAKCAGRRRIWRLQKRGRAEIPRSRVSRKDGRRPSKDTGGTDAGTRSAGATGTTSFPPSFDRAFRFLCFLCERLVCALKEGCVLQLQ